MPGLLRTPAAVSSSCVPYAACALCLLALLVQPCSTSQESYDEELLLTPLPGGALHAYFQFTHETVRTRHHFTFPKAITQVAAAVPFTEAHVSLTQGRWHPQKWGVAPLPVKPTGAEVQVVFPVHLPPAQVEDAWVTLAHALGGLLCTSLHTLAHPSQTAQLRLTSMATSAACHSSLSSLHRADAGSTTTSSTSSTSSSRLGGSDRGGIQLAAALPQEAVCTENLTPWLKLLPCQDAAGLASLLNREAVLLADYHSLSITIQATRDAAGALTRLQLRQTLALVLRPAAGRRAAAGAARRLPPLFPGSYSNWDLSSTFGGAIQGPCPVAGTSRVYVAVPAQHVVQQLQPQWARLAQAPSAGEEEGSRPAPLLRQLLHLDAVVDAGGTPTSSSSEGPDNSSSKSSSRGVKAWSNPLFSLQPGPHQVLARTGYHSPGVTPSDPSKEGVAAVPFGQALQQVLYMYDLHAWQQQAMAQKQGRNTDLSNTASGAPPEEGAAPVSTPSIGRMNIKLKWQGAAASGAQPVPAPAWIASRRTSGAGTMVGAMVLTLQRPPHQHPHMPPQGEQYADDGSRGVPQSPRKQHGQQQQQQQQQGKEAGGQELVCVVQVVPWMVRAWLHTLQLTLDGREVDLEELLVQQHISPARDRQQPLVWELCLVLPASSQRISLEVTFSKAFLTLQEQPPDAYRGFDVPAAKVVHRPIPPGCQWNSTISSGSSGGLQQLLGCMAQEEAVVAAKAAAVGAAAGSSGPGWWRMDGVGGKERAEVGPMWGLLEAPSCYGQVYSPDLLVPLAVPDFSMPYNVICLTSTVLAVYVGSTLNALLRRSSEVAGAAAGGGSSAAAARQQRRRKVVQVVVVAVVFGGLGVYLDPDQRAAAAKALQPVMQALGLGGNPGAAGTSPV